MSSRELLALLDNMVDSVCQASPGWPLGWDTPWPESLQMAAGTHKELALYRAAKYVGGENEYVPNVFIPPEDRLPRYLESIEEERAREEDDETLFADMGFS